jgi:hypothetical protein
MLISHSICAWSTSSKAPSRATPALLMTMFRPGWLAMPLLQNPGSVPGSPTSTRCVLDLPPGNFSDFGGELLQPGLVAIGEREAAAARGSSAPSAADAAGGAGHGGRASGYHSHWVDSMQVLKQMSKKGERVPDFRKLEPKP